MTVAYLTSRSPRVTAQSTLTSPSPSMTARTCTARQLTRRRSTATSGPSYHWWWEPSVPGFQRTTTYESNLTSPGGCGTRPGGGCDSQPLRTRVAWPITSSTSNHWGQTTRGWPTPRTTHERMADMSVSPQTTQKLSATKLDTSPDSRL